MYKTKRAHRRNRWQQRQYLQELDRQVLAEIEKSMSWSMATYGGRRCPSCGAHCRPHHLTNLSGTYQISSASGSRGMHITDFGPACEFIKCPGEQEWS